MIAGPVQASVAQGSIFRDEPGNQRYSNPRLDLGKNSRRVVVAVWSFCYKAAGKR